MPSPGNQFLSEEFGDIEDYFISDYELIDRYIGDTLFTWGENDVGKLGINNITSPICTPVTTFAGGTNWKQVSCSTDHTVAIKTDGTLWSWGDNGYGELGINSSGFGNTRCTPVTTFAGGTNWKQVSCGYRNTLAIKTDGSLWVWGRGDALGTNSTNDKNTPVTTFAGGNNWKQVSGGKNHTAAIKTDGTLWSWGDNGYGELGINNTTYRSTPVTTFAGGNNWKQVSCGDIHTAAIKTDGTLWVWGLNNNGRLGINNATSPICTPVTTFAGGTNWKQVACGDGHTAAIKTDGTLWTWGGTSGLGISTVSNRSTPVTTFAGGTNWKKVSCARFRTAAIKTDGTLWIWGSNDRARLGINNGSGSRATPVTTFAGGNNWKQVSGGYRHTAAVKSGLTVDLS